MFVDRFAFLRLLEVKVTDGDLSIYRHANILRLSDAKKKMFGRKCGAPGGENYRTKNTVSEDVIEKDDFLTYATCKSDS